MLYVLFSSLAACSIIAGVIGIKRKQPITASFILGFMLGPIGILLIILWKKPSVIEQKHISLVRIKQEKELQTNEIVDEFIRIVSGRIKSIKWYWCIFWLLFIVMVVDVIMITHFGNRLDFLLIGIFCLPLCILSGCLLTQNVDSLIEILWGGKVKWTYRFLTFREDFVNVIVVLLMPWFLIKRAKEEMSKIKAS